MNADMQTNPAPNRREVLDCGSPLPLSDRGAQPPTFSRATTVPRPPKAPEDWRTPRRWRATSLAHPMGEGRGEGVPTFPIRAIREIRGQFLLALLLGALLLAGGAGAATLTVMNLADNGPGSLRQLIADASPGDTLDFAVTGTTHV